MSLSAPGCTDVSPEIFFAHSGRSNEVKMAKVICSMCPIMVECGERAIASNERHGTWGGMSEQERMAIRRARGLVRGHAVSALAVV